MVSLKVALTACFLSSALAAQFTPSRDLVERDIIARALQERQYGPPSDTPSPDSQAPPPPADSSEMTVQIVTVSDASGALKYFPESITAQPGSIVQFQFYPKNHTITESTFAEPCKPMTDATSETRPGQKSGFVPVTPDVQFRPVYNLLVNDTKPIWIYCGQTGHCAKGMAMVINQAPDQTEKTLENYKKAAAAMAAGSSSGASSSTTVTTSTSAAANTIITSATTTTTSGPALSTPSSSASASGVGVFNGAAVRPESGRLMGIAGLVVALLVALQ